MTLFSRRRGLLVAAVAVAVSACHPTATVPPTSPILRRVIPARQVLADLALFQRLKEAAHPGIYKYRSKAQMDSTFADACARVTSRMTVLDAYRLVVGITDFEGSLHNDTALPDSVRKALEAEKSFFPYPLKLVAGQLVLNTGHAPLPLGATISSIDGVPARQLVRALGKYYTTDGLNTTGKAVGLAESFPEYFRLEYGPRAGFVVRYYAPGARAIRQQTLPAVTYAAYERAFADRHSRPCDRSFFEGMPAKYTFRLLPTQAKAVLTLNTFDIGEDNSCGHRRYAQFLDSCFQLLRRSPAITHLLVDVRGNGGGDDDNDMLAFSYLARAPFRENQRATMRFWQVPGRRYLTVARDTAERGGIVADIAEELRTDFTKGADGLPHENAHGNPWFQPKPARFRGQLYLLISPRVASAGSMFAAMVRGNTSAVVIGEETMGGYYGHTGHGSLDYTLPNTGIQVSFFRVDLAQAVPVRASQPFGRGVLPDYEVSQSAADFLANRDTQLRFALQLIAAKQPKRVAVSNKR
ncbi:S41 family peptidase [Hymenobacter sp. M29]|uniref:S41 family peptidase n=1 Tax=Hymenobacter mellowenesis TaxID=3063995 RepID=A0ABT9AD01_9BACT|nr:S41 family peptidase [Hymenobacter sp. M29]MDO7847720.1 S41 family peptidase [Hymenobacter sp. M29]